MAFITSIYFRYKYNSFLKNYIVKIYSLDTDFQSVGEFINLYFINTIFNFKVNQNLLLALILIINQLNKLFKIQRNLNKISPLTCN